MTGPTIIASLEKNRRERLRVALDQYQGLNLVDLRVTVELTAATGVQTPTKKGLSLRAEMLPDLVRALQKAQAKAEALGWIGGAS